jgi:DNA-binding LytR/AlgR family response regulator
VVEDLIRLKKSQRKNTFFLPLGNFTLKQELFMLLLCIVETNKTTRLISNNNMNAVVQNFGYPSSNFKTNFYPVIYMDRKKTSIAIRDVIMLEGEGNYTYFHLSNGKKILLSKTLKEFCELFGQNDFARIRKSYLINLNYLKEVDFCGEVTVTMQTGQRIEISRRRKTEFQQQLKKFKQKN